jgi:formate-dependent nitrite reductase membrane component NrfD
VPSYQGPTYYERSTVKPSPFNWTVAAYIFVGGVAGAAQIIAALADLRGRGEAKTVVSPGRYIALAGTIIGAPLLIADLHTPNRWFNMLRIFRATSPMSIGSWILSTFGTFAGATAAADMAEQRKMLGRPGLFRRLARVFQVPAALAGAGMTFYTGGLLTATSTPLWAAAPRLIASRFAGASMAAAAASLALIQRRRGYARSARDLEKLAALATAVELGLGQASDRVYQRSGVASVLDDARFAPAYRGAELLGTVLPLAFYGLDRLVFRGSGGLARPASLAVIAGSAVLRQALMYAGNESARRPRDYLAFTQAPPSPERE